MFRRLFKRTPPSPDPEEEQMRTVRLGDRGDAVQEWQENLAAAGYAVTPDGVFGKKTHNATISWQSERGLDADGVVGAKTWAQAGTDPIPQAEVTANVDSFLLAKNFTQANRSKVDLVVIHSMEAKEASTTAENVAKYFAGSNAPRASAHYNIDADSIVQSVREEDVAWHAPGANRTAIGLEHAGYARQTEEEWNDDYSARMLDRSAALCAEICARWNIPVRYVDAEGLKNGERGITTHHTVNQAFQKSTHWDPGPGFPLDSYIARIKDHGQEPGGA